jgi:hypothetical protein
MPRGGKRPGAGAPKGNLNAFKDGKHSQQYQRFLDIVAKDPEALRLVQKIALGNQQRAARRRRYAMQILGRLLQRLEDQTNDRLTEAWERAHNLQPYPLHGPDPWEKHALSSHQSNPDTDSPAQSNASRLTAPPPYT